MPGIISPGIGQRSAQAVGSGGEPAGIAEAQTVFPSTSTTEPTHVLPPRRNSYAREDTIRRSALSSGRAASRGPSAATVSVPLPGTFGASFAPSVNHGVSGVASPTGASVALPTSTFIGIPASMSALMIPL